MKLFQNLRKVACPGLRPVDGNRQLTHDQVYSEISRLLTLNKDMDEQIRELMDRRSLTEKQWEDYQRIVQEHRELVNGQGAVIEYLRSAYPNDFKIVRGKHQGKGFWDILMGYLKGGQ